MAVEIIGRRKELLALAAFLENVPAGGQALLLEGDAGIGKTALWQEALRAGRERGIQVLQARPSDSEGHLSFAALGDLVGPVLEPGLPQLVPVQRRALETALLLGESEGAPPDVRLLGLAVLSIVRSLARERSVLVAVDDAQWVDSSSADVLTFALRRLGADPVAVLATVRGRPVHAPLTLDRNFSDFRRLAVEPLSVGAVHRLLWSRLGLALPRPVLIRVHRTTRGNAFFALELGRAIADGTIRVDSVDEALPESLRAIVAQRLSALPDRVRETLVAVAALASPSVIALKPLGGHVVDDIELARRRRVLELDGDRIRFTHPLLAPACYEALPLHRRRLVHERLAELDLDPEERARHLAIAAEGPSKAVAAALDAGAQHAAARGAGQVAADLAERAAALTPPDELDDLNRRRIAAAIRCGGAGDVNKAAAFLQEAADSTGPGPLRAEALFHLAIVRGQGKGHRAAIELLERALGEPALEARQRARILESLAWRASVSGDSRDSEQALGWAKEALALAEEVGEPEALVVGLTTVADIEFWRTGHIRRDLLDRAIEINANAGIGLDPRLTLAHELGRADHFGEARKMFEVLLAEARAQTSPSFPACLHFFARMELGAGRWSAATLLCDELIEFGRQTGQDTESLALIALAEIDAYRGVEQARATIPELMEVAAGLGYGGARYRLTRALASLELSVGDAATSWEHLEPLLAGLEHMDEVAAQLTGSVGIETLAANGDLPAAERLQELLEERAAGSETALQAFADRGRGLLLDAQGDQEGAIAALEAAAAEPRRPQEANPFELARTLQLLGTVQRRAQHKRAARETLQRSLTIFEGLGARLWAERARSELRRIGGRTVPTDGELSETERQIVELVVAGRKNSEVAAELNLSPNTIAWNLSKIYRKLGVRSRTELAAQVSATPPA